MCFIYTGCNYVTKHHGIVTIRRTSAIKVTALSKTHFLDVKGIQKKKETIISCYAIGGQDAPRMTSSLIPG